MRHKDQNWSLPEGDIQASGQRAHQWDSIQAAILMDIRDELKQMNRVLACPNFQRIPKYLRVLASRKRRTRKGGRPS